MFSSAGSLSGRESRGGNNPLVRFLRFSSFFSSPFCVFFFFIVKGSPPPRLAWRGLLGLPRKVLDQLSDFPTALETGAEPLRPHSDGRRRLLLLGLRECVKRDEASPVRRAAGGAPGFPLLSRCEAGEEEREGPKGKGRSRKGTRRFEAYGLLLLGLA